MNNSINIFLLLFGSLQGVLIFLYLLRKKVYRYVNFYLGLFVWVLVLQILMKVVQKVWLREHLLWWYDISYYLPLLYAPLVYLYIRQYLYPHKYFNTSTLYHFIPFVAMLIIHSNYWLFPKSLSVIFHYSGRLSTQFLSLGVYYFLSLGYIRHWEKQNQSVAKENQSQLHWLKTLDHLTLLVGVSISLALVLLHAFYPQYTEYRFLFLFLTVFIYWLSYQAIANPSIFNGLSLNESEKYAHSTLSPQEAENIFHQLTHLMKQEKYYLNADLNLQKLANQLQISKHILSQVLNEVTGKNYYDFVNEYRVKEAKRLLLNPKKQQFTIAALAYEAGFSSLSAFNEIFKKHTQLTPSQFRKSHLIAQEKLN